MSNNPLYKSQEEQFINNDPQYNFGGWVPPIAFVPAPSPSPTPSPTSTITPTPSITPTLTPTQTGTPTPTPTPSAAGIDPDAQIYLDEIANEGGSLSTLEKDAVNTFFVDLKTNGLFNKFYYLHLFLGGNAGSNGLNAINPGLYNLTWNGTWTHSNSGSNTTQNNSNYAKTGFAVSLSSPSTTQSDFSMGYMIDATNRPISQFQYQGIGTNNTNYMIIGHDLIQGAGGWIQNFWPSNPGNIVVPSTNSIKLGMWNSVSRSGTTSWFSAYKGKNTAESLGLTFSSLYSTSFTPSSTSYEINLFRVEGLNNYTIGGTALLNYASTYLSPAELDTFMTISNTLQVSFSREIFTP